MALGPVGLRLRLPGRSERCSASDLGDQVQAPVRSAAAVAVPSFRDSAHTDPFAVAVDSDRANASGAALVAERVDDGGIFAGADASASDVPACAAAERASDASADDHTSDVAVDDEVAAVVAVAVCHLSRCRHLDGDACAAVRDAAAAEEACPNSTSPDGGSRGRLASFRLGWCDHCFRYSEEISCLFHAAAVDH